MKKLKLIFMLISALLVLLSSSVLAAQLGSLNFDINIVQSDGPAFEFNGVDGISLYSEICSLAQSKGISEDDIETISVRLEYKNNVGEYVSLEGINITDYPSAKIPYNRAGNIFNIPYIFSDSGEYHTSERYEEMGAQYAWHNYITADNHTLYAGIYVSSKQAYTPTKIAVLPLKNGQENRDEYDDPNVEAFNILLGEDADYNALYWFMEVAETVEAEVQSGDYIMHLNFDSNVEQKLQKVNGKYPQSITGEIIFDVNKGGTYLIIAKYNGEEKNDFPIFTAKYNADASIPYHYGCENKSLEHRIANAGESDGSGTICPDFTCNENNYEEGKFLEDNPNRSYPLKAGTLYAINVRNFENPTAHDSFVDNWEFEIHYINDKLIQIIDHNLQDKVVQDSVTQVHKNGKPDPLEVNELEKLMAFFVRCMANGMIYTTNSALGKIENNGTQSIVSIDSIIFDKYPLTKLNFFDSSVNPLEPRSEFITMFANNINEWFSNFSMIAIVAYLCILLYMGIRVVMSSTASNQALYKEAFLHWVAGVIILFMFPIVIKYAIEINTTFVGMVEDAIIRDHGGNSIDNSEAVNEIEDPDDTSDIATTDTVTVESKSISENPYSDTDTGYMAVMARRAHRTERLSYAFVYLIMSFQLLIIAIMYYKRLFMVAFLLVIFPIVMVVHVLEKVGNIRMGGAFGKWTKEILIMIFTQSIHAIVYSFSIATVMSAGNANNDWILMLVGVTFLFNGEEILKKILGQSSEMAPSLAKSVAKTAATVMAVKAGTKKLTDNVVGVGSHLSKGINAAREAKSYRMKEALVGKFGEKPKEYKMPAATELAHFKPEYTEFGDTEAIELGNAIQVLNYREMATPEQLRHAIDVVGNAKQSGKHKELLKDLKMSDSKFKALNNAVDTMATDAVSGHKTKEQIDMELTMELERIFPNEDIRSMRYMAYAKIGNPLYKNPTQLDSSKVRDEVDDARTRYKKLRNRIKIADEPAKDTGTNKELEERAVKLLHDVYGAKDHYTTEQYQMALSVSMLQNSASGRYDAKELMTSANYVFNNQGNDKQFKRMASAVGVDIGEYRTVLADSVARKAYGENYQSADHLQANSTGRLDSARRMADKVLKEVKDKEAHKKKVGEQKVKLQLNAGKGKNMLTEEGPTEIEVVNDDAPEDDKITVAQLIANDIPAEGESNLTTEQKIEMLVIDEEERRERWSTKSKTILTDFSKEMTEKHKDIFEKKIDGMTRDELHEMAKISRKTARKEIEKTVATTAYSTLLAGPGAAIAIGASDDEGIITEALAGGLGGAVIGDTIVETLTDETHTKKVKMRNPYTGEMEEVEITVTGAFRDDELSMANSEFAAAMSNKLKGQFLEHKLQRDQQFEESKQARMQREETKKRLDESYKKAMEEATRQNNTNNPPDTNA